MFGRKKIAELEEEIRLKVDKKIPGRNMQSVNVS
jgi:hypothetical protein